MSAVARRHYRRGLVALERGELEPAIEALGAAVEVAPLLVSARVAYAVALARLGDHPRAAQSLRAGLARAATATGRGALWATLGDVTTMMGDWLAAEDAFRQAAGVPGFEARGASGLARLYGKTGRYVEAFAALGDAARRCRVG